MTRTQFILALLVAAVLGIALGWFARGPGPATTQTRAHDAAEALKQMNAGSSGSARVPEDGRQ